MIYAGVDIGSRAAKAALIRDDEIISSVIRDTGAESIKTSNQLLSDLLDNTGIKPEEIDYIVATGYGRVLVPYANENVSEISAHAKGINWYFPSVRTILDMGGQDCKAINCDENGNVTNFIMNDKCAGGTGRFLEMIAEVLNVPLEEIGELSLQSGGKIPFNTICAVFAKSEALRYSRKGVACSDILAGLHEAIATRSYNLLKRVSLETDFSITGGISKNSGLVASITEKVQMEPRLCEDPQLCGAIGAALFARDKCASAGVRAKMQYGYDDATGSYYITVDEGLCDGCGKCVGICPAELFSYVQRGGIKVVEIKEGARKRLPTLCSGIEMCGDKNGGITCQKVCNANAIEHSW